MRNPITKSKPAKRPFLTSHLLSHFPSLSFELLLHIQEGPIGGANGLHQHIIGLRPKRSHFDSSFVSKLVLVLETTGSLSPSFPDRAAHNFSRRAANFFPVSKYLLCTARSASCSSSSVQQPMEYPNHGALRLFRAGSLSSFQIWSARSMNSFFGKDTGGQSHLARASMRSTEAMVSFPRVDSGRMSVF